MGKREGLWSAFHLERGNFPHVSCVAVGFCCFTVYICALVLHKLIGKTNSTQKEKGFLDLPQNTQVRTL